MLSVASVNAHFWVPFGLTASSRTFGGLGAGSDQHRVGQDDAGPVLSRNRVVLHEQGGGPEVRDVSHR